MERAFETVILFGSLLVSLLALFVPIAIGIALAQRWIGPERLQRWLGGSNLAVALTKGTLLGAVTPFCGCSTVPLLLGLLKANVRFAAVAAFMLASPLLNPYILGVVTLLFGVRTMVVYAAVAVAATVVIATLWEMLRLDRYLKVPGYCPDVRVPSPMTSTVNLVVVPTPASVSTAGSSCGPAAEGSCGTSAADGARAAWRGLREEVRAAWPESIDLLRPMMRPLLLGMMVGALIYGAVPEGLLANLLGESTWYTLPLAAVLGLPLYLRGEAAFPIGAALMSAGVGAGPMFAMVIAGMGASLPEVTLLSGIFQRRLLAIFLGSIFAMAVVGGALIPVALG
jgi:uncharacterized protein